MLPVIGNETGAAAANATAKALNCHELTLQKASNEASSTTAGAIQTAILLNLLQLLVALLVTGCLAYSSRSKKAFLPLRAREQHSGGLWAYVREAMTANAEECMPIDGQILVRLCQLGFKFFSFGTLTSFVLMPLYAHGQGHQKSILRVSTSNLTPSTDRWIFHYTTVAAYLQVAVFFFLMHEEWGHYVRIRHRHFAKVAMGECGPSAAQARYSLMVERVPKDARTPEAVRLFFEDLFDSVGSVVLMRDTSELYKMQVLETATTSICCGLPCCKKTISAGVHGVVKLEQGFTRTARNTAQAMGQIAEGGTTGLRGVANTGADLIQNIGRNFADVATWPGGSVREDNLKPTSTAFVTLLQLRDRVTAEQVIVFSARGGHRSTGSYKDWVIRPAPEACDIVWQNVAIAATEVRYRSQAGVLICLAGFSLWAAPVSLIQVAVSQQNLANWAPSLLAFMNKHLDSFTGLVFGYMPVLALMGLLFLLPYILNEFAIRFEARKVKSDIVCVVLWRNFLFQLATLWATVFSGTISNSLRQILRNPSCAYIILGESIPKVSVYFTSFVIARIGISLPLLLLPIQSFLILFRVTKSEPQYCYFETEAVNIALVFVLGLMYALVAPAILPACMVYFGLATAVYRWKFLNVYTPQFSCGGAFWSELFTGVLIGLLLGLLSLVGLAAVYAGPRTVEFGAICMLPVFACAFYYYCTTRLAPLSASMPYQDAVQIDRECSAKVCETFSSDYYRDPILKPPPSTESVGSREDDGDSSSLGSIEEASEHGEESSQDQDEPC